MPCVAARARRRAYCSISARVRKAPVSGSCRAMLSARRGAVSAAGVGVASDMGVAVGSGVAVGWAATAAGVLVGVGVGATWAAPHADLR